MKTQATYTPETGYVFKPGSLAYVDTFAGLVPCKVLSVSKGGPFPGWIATGENALCVKLTATRQAYRKGETIENRTAAQVVPRSHVITRGGQYRIRTNYSWQD